MIEKKPLKKSRTKRSELCEIDNNHVWHPFTRMLEWDSSEKLIIEKALGNYLIDTEGNKYLDATSSLWVTVHGHRRAEIDKAVRAQLGRVAHSTLLGLGGVSSIELARELIKVTPKGLGRIFFSDNGSTAVEAALKIAYHFQQTRGKKKAKKLRFIAFTGAYHGDTVGAMSVGEIDKFVARYNQLIFKAERAPYPYCYRCPVKSTYPGCRLKCLDRLEAILKRNPDSIAAVIIEPLVQGAAGMITSPPGFLKGVARLAKRYRALLIADEVATGFGRTGTLFACEAENVVPDILCVAKGLTGGYLPLAATITNERIYKSFLGTKKDPDAFYHGHTYTGNPLGCEAARANLEIFQREGTIKKIQPLVELLAELLAPLAHLEHVGDIRQRGLMAGVEIVMEKNSKKSYPSSMRTGERICKEAENYGVLTRPLMDTIVILPPLSIKKTELRRIVTAIKKSIITITEGRA
ncbi:Adenosylmethionine-8-amino-7-oxononanoate aminotransferase [hydrothermal vent metagenome]|uniref:Adenosylmethionine-8-amino-7-oxononanoate aminotransferase n=1 Tax=hydrothermal vent metagenome TaxID=652676 RepID=A0A3B0V6R1_9ZZZZ